MSPDADNAYAYALPEVARRLGVSRHTVGRMIAAGELPVVRVYGIRRVTHRALQAYLDRLSEPLTVVQPKRRLASQRQHR
jgi:excisionase family DNA binding protein